MVNNHVAGSYRIFDLGGIMSEKAVSHVPQIRHGVYRVPIRTVFRKKHTLGDPSWDDIYGKVRCAKCHENFKEGEAYERAPTDNRLCPRYQHVECPGSKGG